MVSNERVIFDLDGTLYSFIGDGTNTFTGSNFYQDLRIRIVEYIAEKLAISREQSLAITAEIANEYDGELSIGFEKKYGIDRYEYYQSTWGVMDVEKYITLNQGLAARMEKFTGRSLLLTAAPKVWAEKVLKLLGIDEVFGNNIISGEPDTRKPQPGVFIQAREILNVPFGSITSVGDQDVSDIIPAKSVGMKTIIIAPTKQSADRRADTLEDALTLLEEGVYGV